MGYLIVKAANIKSLEAFVQDQLSLGWTPQGGICINKESHPYSYFQAMILKENTD